MKKNYSWINYIKDRVNKKNRNFLCIISGQVGSGKSFSAISIAEMLNEDFSIKRLVFRGRELMNLINSGDFDKRKGVCFVWDEAGVDLSSRNWQSLANKMLNFLLQTFRHQNFVLIFTAPYSDFLDIASRKLFHAEFQTVSINRTKNTVRVKPKLLQYNASLKKWYTPYLRVVKKDIGLIKIKRWDIPKPSNENIKDYEIKKNIFNKELNREIEDTLNYTDSQAKVFRKPLTPLQNKILDCWKKGIFIQSKIGEKLSKTQTQICSNELWMRRKGYNKEKYKIDLEKP